ncbi:MdtA/MuxA family multidrug efflux RND transporter periplasmic adaptor subunit [Escherichia coli]
MRCWWSRSSRAPRTGSGRVAKRQTAGAPTASGARGARRQTPWLASRALAPVQAATATSEAVPRYLSGLGTVTAANTVTVRSRVDGQLLAIHFTEGQQVKAGDLLAEIDPSQFKVALAQAEGQLAEDRATLANARRDLARYQQLVKTNLVSRQELDTQQSLVAETQGTIKADEAAVASAQLQLDWSRITAPIDGRVGLKQVDIGNQIASGDTTGIVVLTQTHPIRRGLYAAGKPNRHGGTGAEGGEKAGCRSRDRTNKQKISEGSLLSLDNQIDATTGTIKLKARFTNWTMPCSRISSSTPVCWSIRSRTRW